MYLKNISEKIKYFCGYKDFFETYNHYYIVTVYYDDNLQNFLNQKGHLSPILINKIFRQLNEAFKELLINNIAYKDIKPSNILIKFNDDNDDDNKINFDSILSDYGIYKDQNDKDIFVGTQVGVLHFMDFIWDRDKNTCDLYSIGVTIYQLYFGKYPFDDFPDGTYSSENLPKIEEDKDLDNLIRKILKQDPNERISWKDYYEHPFFMKYDC